MQEAQGYFCYFKQITTFKGFCSIKQRHPLAALQLSAFSVLQLRNSEHFLPDISRDCTRFLDIFKGGGAGHEHHFCIFFFPKTNSCEDFPLGLKKTHVLLLVTELYMFRIHE